MSSDETTTSSPAARLAALAGGRPVVLVVGAGSRTQMDRVEADACVDDYLKHAGWENAVYVYGGDACNPDKPDVGYVASRLAAEGKTLFAVQTEKYAGYCKETDFIEQTVAFPDQTDEAGKLLFSGWRRHADGSRTPVGCIAVLLEARRQHGLNFVELVAFGGGRIAADEALIAQQCGLSVRHYDLAPRVQQDMTDTSALQVRATASQDLRYACEQSGHLSLAA